jgi:hypothetical protein
MTMLSTVVRLRMLVVAALVACSVVACEADSSGQRCFKRVHVKDSLGRTKSDFETEVDVSSCEDLELKCGREHVECNTELDVNGNLERMTCVSYRLEC